MPCTYAWQLLSLSEIFGNEQCFMAKSTFFVIRNPRPVTRNPKPETRLMVLNREASIPIDRSEFPHVDEVEQLIEKHFKIKDGLVYGLDVDAKLYTIELPNERVLSFPTFWLEDLPDEGPGRIDFYIRMTATYGWEEWETTSR